MPELDLEAIKEYIKFARGRWVVHDCEGDLQVWRLSAVRKVERDETGEITNFQPPGHWLGVDLIAEWDLNTWDPGEDEDDDERRRVANLLARAPEFLESLVAEVEQLQRGGKELGKIFVLLGDLIRDAFLEGADDPISALHMLGNHLAEILPDEGGLAVEDHNRAYHALEKRRREIAEVGDLRADRDRARDAAVALEQENARLREQVEDRVHRAFADADVEGVDLNTMTVAELTAFIMAALDGGEQR